MTRSGRVLQLDIGQFSDPGLQRQNNEDWLGTFRPDEGERQAEKGELFLVADGMGGHWGGELASRCAVDQAIRGYMDLPADDTASSLRRAFESANATLYSRGSDPESGKKWGTTLVVAVVQGDQLWVANVGDSRAYLLRDRSLRQISRDHSFAAYLSEELSDKAFGRHLVTRALGRKPSVEVDVFTPKVLRTGDRILLCSDGLTSPLSDREIRDVVVRYPPQQAARALVEAANDRGGPDNISVIVIQVSGSRPAPARRGVPASLALTGAEAWVQAEAALRGILFEREERLPTVMLILAGLLVALAIIGLGYALGRLIFR